MQTPQMARREIFSSVDRTSLWLSREQLAFLLELRRLLLACRRPRWDRLDPRLRLRRRRSGDLLRRKELFAAAPGIRIGAGASRPRPLPLKPLPSNGRRPRGPRGGPRGRRPGLPLGRAPWPVGALTSDRTKGPGRRNSSTSLLLLPFI